MTAEKTLNDFLSDRPDAQELVEKNILKDPKIAPALQQQYDDLARAKIQDSLRHKIERRPSRERLVESGILDPTMGETFHKVQDTLKDKIIERPGRDALVEQGILSESAN